MRKRSRKSDKYILEAMHTDKTKAYRFKEIRATINSQGHRITDQGLSDNLKYLIQQGKIIKLHDGRYCLAEFAGKVAQRIIRTELVLLHKDLRQLKLSEEEE